jgi:hypothetical protein
MQSSKGMFQIFLFFGWGKWGFYCYCLHAWMKFALLISSLYVKIICEALLCVSFKLASRLFLNIYFCSFPPPNLRSFVNNYEGNHLLLSCLVGYEHTFTLTTIMSCSSSMIQYEVGVQELQVLRTASDSSLQICYPEGRYLVFQLDLYIWCHNLVILWRIFFVGLDHGQEGMEAGLSFPGKCKSWQDYLLNYVKEQMTALSLSQTILRYMVTRKVMSRNSFYSIFRPVAYQHNCLNVYNGLGSIHVSWCMGWFIYFLWNIRF